MDLRQSGRDFRFEGDRQQWRWEGRSRRHAGLAYPALRGVNQLLNAAGVLAAFEALHSRLPINAQAVRAGLALVELPGRFQALPGQPAIVLDVAHNPHAVAALAQNLDQMGFSPRTRVVFGAMADKALEGVFAAIAPWVDHWCFTDLPTARAATAADLTQRWQALAPSLKSPGEVSFSQHPDPVQALAHARALSDPADRIVVFGSFYTVGAVLGSLGRGVAPAGQPPSQP